MKYEVQTPNGLIIVNNVDNVTVNDSGAVVFWSEGWCGLELVTAFAPGHWFEITRMKNEPDDQKTAPEGE